MATFETTTQQYKILIDFSSRTFLRIFQHTPDPEPTVYEGIPFIWGLGRPGVCETGVCSGSLRNIPNPPPPFHKTTTKKSTSLDLLMPTTIKTSVFWVLDRPPGCRKGFRRGNSGKLKIILRWKKHTNSPIHHWYIIWSKLVFWGSVMVFRGGDPAYLLIAAT